MAITRNYRAKTQADVKPDVVEPRLGSKAILRGVNDQWQAPLQGLPTLDGTYHVPDVPVGQLSIQAIIPPEGLDQYILPYRTEVLNADDAVEPELKVHGKVHNNVYYIGGQLQTQEFQHGIQGLTITEQYVILGVAVDTGELSTTTTTTAAA